MHSEPEHIILFSIYLRRNKDEKIKTIVCRRIFTVGSISYSIPLIPVLRLDHFLVFQSSTSSGVVLILINGEITFQQQGDLI